MGIEDCWALGLTLMPAARSLARTRRLDRLSGYVQGEGRKEGGRRNLKQACWTSKSVAAGAKQACGHLSGISGTSRIACMAIRGYFPNNYNVRHDQLFLQIKLNA